jgi:transcriptional regulator with GAF, ATPase, and Fis domain
MDIDTKQLRELIAECKGNTRELGARLGVSKQAANRRVKNAGLAKFAAGLRAMHGVKGTRIALKQDPGAAVANATEKDEIEAALKEHGTQSGAARALGMGRTRLQRAMERLGIT